MKYKNVSQEMIDNWYEERYGFGCDEDDERLDSLFRPKKSNSRKSLISLYVYKIITEETSPEKHVSQKEIAKRLTEYPYEIEIERKALSRVIHNLEDTGFGIMSDPKLGCWFDKDMIWGGID